MTLFDRYVMVDWSAAAVPSRGPNSVWVAVIEGGASVEVFNVATRAETFALLVDLCSGSGRTLVGIDVSFGAPAGLAEALGHVGGQDVRWQTVWDAVDRAVVEGPANLNNRFEAAGVLNRRVGCDEGPFWGRPARRAVAGLNTTRPGFDLTTRLGVVLGEYRQCEIELRGQGLRPASTWKVAYPASVGGQFLTAIGWLLRLKAAVDSVALWPFEPWADARVVVAEVWPGRHGWTTGEGPRDRDQVVGVVAELAQADTGAELVDWLGVAARLPAACRHEEGWVLGLDYRA